MPVVSLRTRFQIVVSLTLLVAARGASSPQDSPERAVVMRAAAAVRKAEPTWRFSSGILNLPALPDEILGAAAGRWFRSLNDPSMDVGVMVYRMSTPETAAGLLYRQAHAGEAKGWTVTSYELGDGANMATLVDPSQPMTYDLSIRKGAFIAHIKGSSKETVEHFAQFLLAGMSDGPTIGGVPPRDEQSARSLETQSAITDAEAYAVYAAHLVGAKPDRRVPSAPLIIQSATENWDRPDCIREPIKKEWQEVVADYRRKNARVWTIQDRLRLDTPYEFVSKEALLATLGKQSNWPAFDRLHPGSGGYLVFSAIGFNADRTRAMLQSTYTCGPKCANGGYSFLEKSDGRWTRTQPMSTCGWIS
jgi:hypothetical protein